MVASEVRLTLDYREARDAAAAQSIGCGGGRLLSQDRLRQSRSIRMSRTGRQRLPPAAAISARQPVPGLAAQKAMTKRRTSNSLPRMSSATAAGASFLSTDLEQNGPLLHSAGQGPLSPSDRSWQWPISLLRIETGALLSQLLTPADETRLPRNSRISTDYGARRLDASSVG